MEGEKKAEVNIEMTVAPPATATSAEAPIAAAPAIAPGPVEPGKAKTGHFCFEAEELSAPDAAHPNNFFDWQHQGDLATILARYGGIQNIAQSLGTDLTNGLTKEQIEDPERVKKYDTNKPEQHKGVGYWELIFEGLKDFTLIVLIVAAAVSIVTGGISEGWTTGWIDGFAILVAVVIILNVSAINDLQKDRQFRKLNAINNRKRIKAVRCGETIEITTDDILVGDVLYITAGDTIPADLYYLSGSNVKIDESKLTGEPDQLRKDDAHPFIVSSSECHDGSFRGLTIAVGHNSVFGKMKTMIEGGGDDQTPLQLKLEKLTKQISIVGFAVGVLVIVVLIIIHVVDYSQGRGTKDENGKPQWKKSNWNSIVQFFITGVAILVVAIPEGLPLAVTIALAYSVKRMMKDQNLVRHLNACETMGGANTICSDKTGTLTLGQMTVMQGWIYRETNEDETQYLNKYEKLSGEERAEFIANCKAISPALKTLIIENSNLNNDAFLIDGEDGKPERANGSSLDIALIKWTRELGPESHYMEMRKVWPKMELLADKAVGQCVVKQNAFHSNRKRSSVVVRTAEGKYRVYVKGAPEMLMRLCENTISDQMTTKQLTGNFTEDAEGHIHGDGSRSKIVEHCILPMARTGLRVIALAYRDLEGPEDWEETVEFTTEEQKGVGPCPKVESNLTLIGLVGVQDPPRPEVPEAVRNCQKAGIFVRMVTGDNIETAKAIATQVHIYHHDGYTDGQGRRWPPGRCITGPQFRESVGGLVLPPHFFHECKCADLKDNAAYKDGYRTPAYPVHYGYPSIVGHISDQCLAWKAGARTSCNDECKQRGCVKQMKKVGDKSEEQKYLVIRNQYVFDQYVDTLQVMARSAPTDKHMLVTGLMERRLVVAVTGDGTNDGPALSKSSVGFAMGIAGTSIAKDASDIILMDDNFTSIVRAVMWGRNVYDSIRKFLQFQLTVNCVALALSFIAACVIKESPLKPIQMLWVNLIMDTFASLALATEYPTPDLLDRGPYHRDESLISKPMLRNILGHFYFQFVVVMVFTFKGNEIFDVPLGTHLPPGTESTVHLTSVFNVFVCMQIFNEINSRKINNEWNIFKGIFTNWLFLAIVVGTVAVQIILITFGGKAFYCARMSVLEHVVCYIFGLASLIVTQLIRFVPSSWFIELGSGSVNKGSANPIDFIQRSRSRRTLSQLPSVSGEANGSKLKKLFT